MQLMNFAEGPGTVQLISVLAKRQNLFLSLYIAKNLILLTYGIKVKTRTYKL